MISYGIVYTVVEHGCLQALWIARNKLTVFRQSENGGMTDEFTATSSRTTVFPVAIRKSLLNPLPHPKNCA